MVKCRQADRMSLAVNFIYLLRKVLINMANTLGSRIRSLREKMNLSQKQLAEHLSITNVQLSRYESGDRKPDPEMIKVIAQYFSVTTDYLLGHSVSIGEDSAAYLSQTDKELLEIIKSNPLLEGFIRDLLQDLDHLHKIINIWAIIRSENNE